MSTVIECPNCGAPAKEVPRDPHATLRCRYCGATYERAQADGVLAQLRQEVMEWLAKTTGGETAIGVEAVDEATRSFLFNDRILPGLRREVRTALDEGIGDVEGSPLVVPPVLHLLSGFRAQDATLVTRRAAVLALRPLLVKLSAPEVAAFARTPADQAALSALRADCERTIRLSNVACALAHGLQKGATVANSNLEELEREELPANAEHRVAVAASRARASALRVLMRAVATTPQEPEEIAAAAQALEATGAGLLSPDSRSLRGALASTGIDRDATAIHLIASVARAVRGLNLSLVGLLDGLGQLSGLLNHVARPRDAAPIVHSWAVAVASRDHGAPVPAVSDVSWLEQMVKVSCKGATMGRFVQFGVPYWSFPVRHTKKEGLFLVSGKQQSGHVFVPASASPEGLLVGDRDVPWVAASLHAISNPTPTELRLDLAVVGPEASRVAARGILAQRGMKNITLGDAALVYLPLCVTEVTDQRGRATVSLVPAGPSPHVQKELLARLDALDHVAAAAVSGRSG